MRNLIALSTSLFLLSIIPAKAQSPTANNAISCAAVYFVASTLSYDEEQAQDLFIRLQVMFQAVYSAFESDRLGHSIDNNTIAEIKSEAAIRLGELYDQERHQVYSLEMQCNEWRKGIFPYLVEMIESEPKNNSESSILLGIPPMPSVPGNGDVRWSQSMELIDQSFLTWTQMERVTPRAVEEKLRN